MAENRAGKRRRLTTRAGMRDAARLARQRRGLDHRYVVGQFYLVDGRVVLRAVYMGPSFDVPRPPIYTEDAARFCRWRTRQAAHQFAQHWRLATFHVIDMAYLDVLTPAS